MRVSQFVTLFLALTVVCGCSHRRTQRVPVTASLCECSTCRCDQERLIREGAIPADHFEGFDNSQTEVPAATPSPFEAQPTANDIAPEYGSSSPNSVPTTRSPYSSGNPIEMGEAPQTLNAPAVDKIKVDSNQFPPSASGSDLNLNLEQPPSNQITTEPEEFGTIDQIPSQTLPDGAFQPFDRDVFKVKSKIENVKPVDQQPSILIDTVSDNYQPDLSSLVLPSERQLQMPQAVQPSTNDFSIPDSSASNHLSLEQGQVNNAQPLVLVAENSQPALNQLEPAAELTLPTLNETVPDAQTFSPVPQPIRQTETVVEGDLYEDPVVLYARQRRGVLTASAVQTPGTVRAPQAVEPASMQKPAKHQSIVQNSEFDPIYGLPLSNDVQFDSLPAIQPPPVVQQPAVQLPAVAPSNQPQHLHVHIHHDYDNASAGQVRHSEQTDHQARNVQVVYRDDEGRVIMAPPTPTGSIHSAEPTGDQRTYYVPPEQILRLKATSPINRPRSNPSVATIQMRDTVTHGGTHLLATPDYQAQPVLIEHGLPGINYEKLREAFKSSPTENPLR